MKTSTAETRTAYGSQPIARPSAKDNREQRRERLSDARLVVCWLNTAKEAEATASYSRVIAIHRGLTEFAKCRARLEGKSAKWMAALEQLEEQRRWLLAGRKGTAVQFPASRRKPEEIREAERLHSEINQQLCRYVCRPRVTYFLNSEAWIGGLVPDSRPEWFVTQLGTSIVSEPDAVLALVRLDLTDETSKVRLCEMCRERWCVGERSHYRFCSQVCREAWYESQPGYHERKARNQRRSRQREKRREALTRAISEKRRK